MRNDVRRGMADGNAVRDDADDDRCEDRDNERWKHASRQVLQHLAFGAVVVVGMRRAAGDRRSVEMMIGIVVAGDVHMRRDAVEMRAEIVDEPRKRAERRPGEREQRIPCDTDSPAAGVKHRSCRAGSSCHRMSVRRRER